MLAVLLSATVWTWRRGKLWLFVAGVTLALGAAWAVAKELVRRDWRDADGYIDCWPNCSAVQDGVALAIWVGPVLLVVLIVAAGVLAAITGPRGVRGQRA